MTLREIIHRRYFILQRLRCRIKALPGVWRVLGDRGLSSTEVKGADGSMIPFDAAVTEAFANYEPNLTDAEKASRRQDMVRVWHKQTITPEEYYIFGFEDMPEEERRGYISRIEKGLGMCIRVGIDENFRLLNDKYLFYRRFSQFFKRDVCRLSEREEDRRAFADFCAKHPRYIAKNSGGHMGFGTVIRENDGTPEGAAADADALLGNGKEWVVEELIRQDPGMAAFNATSVNTVRVCSRWNSEGFSVFETFVRVGRAGSVVDNICSGGITAIIDPATGVVVSEARDKFRHEFPAHPDSGTTFRGFQIPRWDELLAVVRAAHGTIPNYPYVGWDLALSERDGWVLVEGNWGNFITQYFHRGMREEYYKCFR